MPNLPLRRNMRPGNSNVMLSWSYTNIYIIYIYNIIIYIYTYPCKTHPFVNVRGIYSIFSYISDLDLQVFLGIKNCPSPSDPRFKIRDLENKFWIEGGLGSRLKIQELEKNWIQGCFSLEYCILDLEPREVSFKKLFLNLEFWTSNLEPKEVGFKKFFLSHQKSWIQVLRALAATRNCNFLRMPGRSAYYQKKNVFLFLVRNQIQKDKAWTSDQIFFEEFCFVVCFVFSRHCCDA